MNVDAKLAGDDGSDALLAQRSAAGDREAFGEIVARYQTLVCSLAYNATGNLARSEDLAQETFLTAWQHLRELREPAKLRSWLCGIARNGINNRRRLLKREPTHDAEELKLATDVPAVEPWPSDAAVARDNQAILWQALERVPEIYREPLILFYREHRSIERVAADLDLSEDTVKQRLSRGRKLLHEQVLAFVEGALEQSAPGPAFTLGVVGALPLLATSGLATTAAAGGTAAKWAAAGLGTKLLTVFNVAIGPLVGIATAWLGVRASIDDTHSRRERKLVKRCFLTVAAGSALFTLASAPLNVLATAQGGLRPGYMVLWLALLMAYIAGIVILALRLQRVQQQVRREDRMQRPATLGQMPENTSVPPREFRSRWSFLGLPLVHVRLHPRRDEAIRPALGWIAIGNYAFGILFACGGVSVGAVSLGGLSVGLVSIAAVSLGFLALGGLAIGVYAMGGVAVGLIATGAFSFGWVAAEGRYAVAREFALGVHAAARQANDEAARAFFAARPWLDLRSTAGKALLSLVWLPWILIFIGHVVRARRPGQAPRSGLPPVG